MITLKRIQEIQRELAKEDLKGIERAYHALIDAFLNIKDLDPDKLQGDEKELYEKMSDMADKSHEFLKLNFLQKGRKATEFSDSMFLLGASIEKIIFKYKDIPQGSLAHQLIQAYKSLQDETARSKPNWADGLAKRFIGLDLPKQRTDAGATSKKIEDFLKQQILQEQAKNDDQVLRQVLPQQMEIDGAVSSGIQQDEQEKDDDESELLLQQLELKKIEKHITEALIHAKNIKARLETLEPLFADAIKDFTTQVEADQASIQDCNHKIESYKDQSQEPKRRADDYEAKIKAAQYELDAINQGLKNPLKEGLTHPSVKSALEIKVLEYVSAKIGRAHV